MAVKISHASIDENGKAKGGKAGDQTGKEVKISSWYKSNWDFVARPKQKEVSRKMVAEAVAGANNPNIGYDQGERNDLLTEAKKVGFDLAKITVPCEADCSSFVSVCVLAAGVDLKYSSNLPTTSNLRSKLLATGEFDILTDKKYLDTSNHLIAGDVLCRERGHVVIVVEGGTDNATVATAPVAASKGDKIKAAVTYSVNLPLLQRGDSGPQVEAAQTLLKLRGCDPGTIDGEFGRNTEEAVKELQKKANKPRDGKIGGQTWPVLIEGV